MLCYKAYIFLSAIEMVDLIIEKYKLTHHLKWHELALIRALFKKLTGRDTRSNNDRINI